MFLEMAGVLGLPDLVAVADHLIRRDAPLASLDRLADRLAVGDRLSRRRLAHRALELADSRSESRPESVLRVLLSGCGWGTPEPNFDVRAADGRRMRVDLAFPHLGLAVEYHGDYHRDADQWRRDIARRSVLESLGWTVVELAAADLSDPDALILRIRAIAARRIR
jgi:hypothetical protein